MNSIIEQGIRAVRRVIVGVVGVTIVLIGVALLVLPGPAFVVIPIGLSILALEFAWARRLLKRAQAYYYAGNDRDPRNGNVIAPDTPSDRAQSSPRSRSH